MPTYETRKLEGQIFALAYLYTRLIVLLEKLLKTAGAEEFQTIEKFAETLPDDFSPVNSDQAFRQGSEEIFQRVLSKLRSENMS